MLKISKPLGIGTTKSYYKQEYTKSENSAYYTQQGELQGEWHGKLAQEFGLMGVVTELEYDRLADGQHPQTGEQLIEHRENVKSAVGEQSAHRAGWDFTFGAPKSVSATALVGGDIRIREAHRTSVKTALDAMEEYAQARMGGNLAPQTTANFAAALFEHDTARPVGGGPPDPHLHTHAVVFNMTDATGQVRSLQSQELFRIQQFGTTVYQSELAMRLQQLGYELNLGDGYAPEIKGYTREYLDAISQRRDEIEARKEELGLTGAEAGEVIAKQTRANKQVWDAEELREEHRQRAAEFGNQPDEVIAAARHHAYWPELEQIREAKISEAITHAKDRLSERAAVFDQYEILRDALRVGEGHFVLADVEQALQERIQAGEFMEIGHWRANAPGARYTTPEMVEFERNTIEYVRHSVATQPAIYPNIDSQALQEMHPTLTEDQNRTIREVLNSPDRVQAIQGGAGTGKSFGLQIIQDIARGQGYEVKGIAPTSPAVNNLLKDGIDAETLQAHLARATLEPNGVQFKPTLYMVDETSLASTKQMNDFLHRLEANDRVLLIGDIRQHQSVDAGRIFEELQQAGMRTSRMAEIVRQQDAALRAVVEDFAKGEIQSGLQKMAQQGRIQEIEHRGHRFEAIAEKYAQSPGNTLVISPDNASRQELNRVIREKLQATGEVAAQGFRQPVLVARQEVTGADRKRAESYRPGNIIRFEKASKSLGLEKKIYAEVIRNDRQQNEITIQLANGTRRTYDPKRFYGVQLYTLEHRQFAVGDRVQFTAPWKDQQIANRQLGTVRALDAAGNATVALDGASRNVSFNLNRMNHVDHGYAVTSYSSQALTVDNTLLQIDTADPKARGLMGRELAYVATSRARFDVQIFTDNVVRLGAVLDRKHEKGMALSPDQIQAYKPARDEELSQRRKFDRGIALSF